MTNEARKVACDVPQGTTFRPAFFSIYTNTLFDASKTGKDVAFENDRDVCFSENYCQKT